MIRCSLSTFILSENWICYEDKMKSCQFDTEVALQSAKICVSFLGASVISSNF